MRESKRFFFVVGQIFPDVCRVLLSMNILICSLLFQRCLSRSKMTNLDKSKNHLNVS